MGRLTAAALALLAALTTTAFHTEPPPSPTYWLDIDLFPHRTSPTAPGPPGSSDPEPSPRPAPVHVPPLEPVAPPVIGGLEAAFPSSPAPSPGSAASPRISRGPGGPGASPRADTARREAASRERGRTARIGVPGFRPLQTRPEPLKSVLVVVMVLMVLTALAGAVLPALR
ncbi:hypothetical protein GCM10022221_35820 [Actinocorallia aurea]